MARNIDTNNVIKVKREEFINNDKLKGVKYGVPLKYTSCKICGEQIDASNLKKHEESHSNKYIFVTDNENTNTIKVTELEFFTNLKETHYKIKGEGHYKIAYKNGIKTTIKKIFRNTKPQKQFICEYCGQVIKGKGNINQHIKKHKRKENEKN